jgi:hypothetical protein
MATLRDGAVYLGDNGRLMCRECAGATALYSGCDLSGAKVERLDCSAVREMASGIGRAVTCECGKVWVSEIAGPDGWPMVCS